jgi:hypothetical protein
VELRFISPVAIFNGTVTVEGGSGGNGGLGGQNTVTANAGGSGGTGGNAGAATLATWRDMVINTSIVKVTSGNAGATGDKQGSASDALGGGGGLVKFDVGRDAIVTSSTKFDITIGTSVGTTQAGLLELSVNRNLEIESGITATLDVKGAAMRTSDYITFPSLLFWADSKFIASENVNDAYVFTGTAPAQNYVYQVNNMDLVTGAEWKTLGTYRPDTGSGHYMRFNMADIDPGGTMLNFSGQGTVSLADFDPMSQHEAYLALPDRPRYANDPANWDYGWTGGASDFFTAPAFIMSPYQSKRLHLGKVVLINNIDYGSINTSLPRYAVDAANSRIHYISSGSALGPLYDDFAFTSGLRRYYWNVYAQQGGGGDPDTLIADNYYTADASHVFAQAAAASSIAVNQTFLASMTAMDNAFRSGMVDRYHMEASFAGSHVRTETGSHVNVDNWSGALALSRKSSHSLGETVFGIFGEFSTGDYDTFTQVPRYGDVFGDGDVKTYGGGIFIKNVFTSNTMIEASVRGGGFRNEFRLKGDPWIPNREIHDADTDGTYLGGHVGVTQRVQIGDSSLVDAYGKYFITHTASDSFTTSFGDEIFMDSFNSSRVRVGGRWTEDFSSKKIRLFFGLAYEHEFDGKVTGKNGPDPFAHTVDPTGSSGFGELGLNFNPMENLTVTVGAFGWAGQQKGAGGNAGLNFSF